MIKRLYIFAERADMAFEYMREQHYTPDQYRIVMRVEDVLGIDAEYDQIRTVGNYWNNPQVSFAYDEMMWRIKRKRDACSP